MNWLLLAQDSPLVTPDKGIEWAEKMTRGGVAVICLCVAIAAVVGAVFLFKKLLAERDLRAKLEEDYRKDLENRSKVALADAERRVAEAKAEAKERAAEVDRLMRERMAVEKESDATLAKAILALEGNTRTLQGVERLLEDNRQVLARNVAALDRRV